MPSTRLRGRPDDLIIYLASTWWEGPAGTDFQLAHALRDYGPVLYVDPPISALTRFRQPQLAGVAAAERLRVHDPSIAQLITHVVPGMSRPGLHHLVGPMVKHAIRGAITDLYGRTRGVRVAGVVSTRLDDTWSAVPAKRRLLFVTDDLPAGAELLGLPRERLVAEEAAALRAADAVAVVSPGLQDRYAADGVKSELIPNGCDTERYAGVDEAARPLDVDLPGPIAGFLGYVNDRIDLALLEAVADIGCSLLIVGPLARGYRQADRFAALAARPNVCWTGGRPYAEMASYLRLIDVGLTPYADSDFNRASFPLKTLEYLAAGRAVVATSLPATTWLSTDLIRAADRPDDFAAQVRAELAMPRAAADVRRRRAFAEQHSWRRRAEQIAALLDLTGRAGGASAS
jgi:teichuronic acid biosynthesis glycosyltransferase TuaH